VVGLINVLGHHLKAKADRDRKHCGHHLPLDKFWVVQITHDDVVSLEQHEYAPQVHQ